MKKLLYLVFLWNTIFVFSQSSLIPDSNFGNNGVVVSPYDPFSLEFSAIAIQSDGKIVTYGPINPYYDYDSYNDYKLARYNTDGTLDLTFGNQGIVYLVAAYKFYSPVNIPKNELKILPDGKILLLRNVDSDPNPNITQYDIVVNSYNSNGTLDSSFANGGEYLFSLNGDQFGSVIEIQSDNKIIIGGHNGLSIILTRLNANGTVDQNFANNGLIIYDFIPQSLSLNYNKLRAIKILNNGKILIGGTNQPYYQGQGTINTLLVRLNANGTLDTTFSNNGSFKYDSGFDDQISSMEINSNNQIMAFINTDVFYSTTVEPRVAILRLNSNGLIDTAFGVNGVVIPELNSNDFFEKNVSTFIDSNQKIVCVGFSHYNVNPSLKFIARLNSDGTIDNSFDSDGYQLFSFDNNLVKMNAVKIQNDGKIICAGTRLWRYTFGTLDIDSYISDNAFSIFPNPTGDFINITNNSGYKISSISIYNTLGQLVQEVLKINTFHNIDVSNLESGNYLIKILTENKITTKKFIKI